MARSWRCKWSEESPIRLDVEQGRAVKAIEAPHEECRPLDADQPGSSNWIWPDPLLSTEIDPKAEMRK
jgi:hypothetical protein